LINRRLMAAAILLPCFAMLSGCGSTLHRADPGIGYLDNKYRVCRDNCPQRTQKELDDAEYEQPAIILASHSQPVPTPPLVNREVAIRNNNAETTEIYFDFGMSKPSLAGQKELGRFLDLASRQHISTIDLVGQTDDIGPQNYNTGLALKRADFVARWIKSHGINAAISVTAKGECCRAAPYNKAEETLVEKRRVSIQSQSN